MSIVQNIQGAYFPTHTHWFQVSNRELRLLNQKILNCVHHTFSQPLQITLVERSWFGSEVFWGGLLLCVLVLLGVLGWGWLFFHNSQTKILPFWIQQDSPACTKFFSGKKAVSAAIFSELTMRKISWSGLGATSSGAALFQESRTAPAQQHSKSQEPENTLARAYHRMKLAGHSNLWQIRYLHMQSMLWIKTSFTLIDISISVLPQSYHLYRMNNKYFKLIIQKGYFVSFWQGILW